MMYPGYYHTHGDVELFIKGMLTKTLYVLPDNLNPTHVHPFHTGLPPDEIFKVNNSRLSYDQAEPIFQRRRAEIFQQYGRDVRELFPEVK